MGLKGHPVMHIHSYNDLERLENDRYNSIVPYLPVVTDDFFLELLIATFCIPTVDQTVNWTLHSVTPRGDYYLVLFERIYA